MGGRAIEDFRLALKRKGAGELMRSLLLHPGIQAIAFYRLYHWLYQKGFVTLAYLGWRLNYLFTGADINPNVDIGPDFHLDHPLSVLIWERTHIGRGVRIYSHTAVGPIQLPGEEAFMDIRDNVQIYHGAMVGGNCVIGEYSQIGLNAVVLDRDIPPYSVVVGNPGAVVKIEGKRVNPDDYWKYKYDPADYHGPPAE